MAGKKSPQSAKATKKATGKQVATKAVKSPKGVAKAAPDKPKKAVSKKVAAQEKATTTTAVKRKAAAAKPVKLLSGGNPQIAKADGDAPVQTYIAAMPGWKGDIGRRLDAIIERTVPNVRKGVRWNTPFYGIDDDGWFLAFHCITKYIKVAFFRGTSLHPAPPVESKQKEVRYLHIYEDGQFDEAQFTAWVKQASLLPGERM
ncbi:MAG: hypothetical protein JWP89_4984 [Schlesneria sp.]|nr:hypothetical protein [Schlesneria sp.]